MRTVNRREFLQQSANAAIRMGLASALASPLLPPAAHAVAAFAATDDLRQQIGSEGTVLPPSHPQFGVYRAGFNRRIQAPAPLVLVRCLSADAAAKTILWARQHGTAVRVRSGGHSYEGFSQGPGVVIDTRPMNRIEVDAQNGTATVGAGATLGDVYQALSQHGVTIPAGTCPTVGVAGLALGGGYGFLSRKLGLTCDQLLSLRLVTAEGRTLDVSAGENSDLFWACRGAGGGSFGVVTQLHFRLYPIDRVTTFSLRWSPSRAHGAVQAFQDWAPGVADELTANLTLTATPAGVQRVAINGQFVGPATDLPRLLRPLFALGVPERQTITTQSFMDAVRQFAGHGTPQPEFFKAKSDFLTQPLTNSGIQVLLRSLPAVPGGVVVSFDPYGGAINRVPVDATAFCHRAPTLTCIQYYSAWQTPAATAQRLRGMRALYAAMRPSMSGGAYVNYCDLDLKNWQEAYWGGNFARLTRIKRACDPENVFNHPQSIPVGGPP
jgi:FAD/FMN-containing dehydrogenase